MSFPEEPLLEPERREVKAVLLEPALPKVKLSRNAKGDPQWEITVVEGFTDEVVDALRRSAVRQYQALEQELLGLKPGQTAVSS